jgi:rod shape-determining protein MreC
MLSMLMMFFDHHYEHAHRIRSAVSALVLPLQHVVNFPIQFLDQLHKSFSSHLVLEQENAELKAEQLMLNAEVQRLLTVEAENARLKNLLESAAQQQHRKLVAEIMAVNLNPFADEVTLNKGSRDEVYVGQPVIDAYGILGQVVEVSPTTSRVMLISDKRSAVPVQSSRNGVRAIAVGKGSLGSLMLTHVPETIDIQVGDLFISSGLAQRFPIGYPVGEVVRVEQNTQAFFNQIEIKPMAQLNVARHVVLLWPTFNAANLTEASDA